MIVKHNYQCSFCSTQKTSFVFSDYSMIFAICRSCYDDLIKNASFFEVQDGACSFCGNVREVKIIEGFDDSMFFTDLLICNSCFTKINESIARQ